MIAQGATGTPQRVQHQFVLVPVVRRAELAAQYPEVALQIKYVGDQGGMADMHPQGWLPLRKNTLGDSYKQGQWLRFNSNYSTEAMDNSKRNSVATGFSPPLISYDVMLRR